MEGVGLLCLKESQNTSGEGGSEYELYICKWVVERDRPHPEHPLRLRQQFLHPNPTCLPSQGGAKRKEET